MSAHSRSALLTRPLPREAERPFEPSALFFALDGGCAPAAPALDGNDGRLIGCSGVPSVVVGGGPGSAAVSVPWIASARCCCRCLRSRRFTVSGFVESCRAIFRDRLLFFFCCCLRFFCEQHGFECGRRRECCRLLCLRCGLLADRGGSTRARTRIQRDLCRLCRGVELCLERLSCLCDFHLCCGLLAA